MWRRYLIEGTLLLFPIVLTIVLLVFLVRLIASPLDLWIAYFFPGLPFISFTSQVIALMITFTIILLFGYFGRRWVVKQGVQSIRKLFLKIPFIRAIYHSSHEVVTTVLSQNEQVFSDVVTFPFGDTGGYMIGLLPRRDHVFENTTPVLLPGTPNPLQGFVLYTPLSTITFSSMPVKKAMKWNVSIGTLPL